MLYKLADAFDKFQPSCWETGGSLADGSEQNLLIELEKCSLFILPHTESVEVKPHFLFFSEDLFCQLMNQSKLILKTQKPHSYRGKTFSSFDILRIIDKMSEWVAAAEVFAATTSRR